jgi:hypothetical protein
MADPVRRATPAVSRSITQASSMTTELSGFRYRTPTSENLPRLARLAYEESKVHCGACRDFHVMWPYLRSLGLNGAGPEHNWPLHVETLARAATGRSNVRWFLAGSADAGLLAVVEAAAARHRDASHTFAIVDICGTPVALCAEHARAHGLHLEATIGDLATYRPGRPFDVVLMHQLLYFIPMAAQPAFMRHAAGWLAPGGTLHLTVSVDAAGGRPPEQRNASMVEWREAGIRADAASSLLELPEDVETFVGRLRGMRAGLSATRMPARPLEDYVVLVEAAGLVIDEVLRMPNEPDQIAPARDDAWRHRHMIIARAPSAG